MGLYLYNKTTSVPAAIVDDTSQQFRDGNTL